MSIKSERIYWVHCDRAECRASVGGSPTAKAAIGAARSKQWTRTRSGPWSCPGQHQEAK